METEGGGIGSPAEERPARRVLRRGIFLLPNIITSLSMFFGFLSMVWAVQGRFEAAAMAVMLAALMDGLDGKVARLTHTASEFGVQYDSLADLVAFGLAPAMLMWQWQLQAFGRAGVAAAFLYAACGALRLARFNVSAATTSKRFFVGLPIPAGGCTVASFLLFSRMLAAEESSAVAWAALVLTVGLGILMVSKVRYFSFKEYDYVRAHPFQALVGVMVILTLLCSQPYVFSFLACAAYIAGGLAYTFYVLPRRNRAQPRVPPAPGE